MKKIIAFILNFAVFCSINVYALEGNMENQDSNKDLISIVSNTETIEAQNNESLENKQTGENENITDKTSVNNNDVANKSQENSSSGSGTNTGSASDNLDNSGSTSGGETIEDINTTLDNGENHNTSVSQSIENTSLSDDNTDNSVSPQLIDGNNENGSADANINQDNLNNVDNTTLNDTVTPQTTDEKNDDLNISNTELNNGSYSVPNEQNENVNNLAENSNIDTTVNSDQNNINHGDNENNNDTSSSNTLKRLNLSAAHKSDSKVALNETLSENQDNLNEQNNSDEIQKAKVFVTKLVNNEEKTPLVGAILQIYSEEGELLDEWVTDGSEHVYELPVGNYILREKYAPAGYDLADDVHFTVDVIIDEPLTSGTVYPSFPSPKTALYYVTIDGVDYEVYCINQGLGSPDGADFSGRIITPDDIRNYTKQETNVDLNNDRYTVHATHIDAEYTTISDYDVSDQSMTNQELYDKTLDIIYRRYLAEEEFKDTSVLLSELGKTLEELNITEEELLQNSIRWMTEYALKNYLNARITTSYESERHLADNGYTIIHDLFNEDGTAYTEGKSYMKYVHKFYNREYVYDPSAPAGYIISRGNGDSFGNVAKSWAGESTNKIPAYYANLYYFLIDDNGPHHPSDMQLYVYSSDAIHEYVYKGQTYQEPYQNVLGINGYFKDIKVKDQHVTMYNDYSSEKTSITIEKIWEDNNNLEGFRPSKINVELLANGKVIDKVELFGDENIWTYTFNDLPKYDEGKEIIYTVNENKVDNYETIIDGYKIINYRDVETTEIHVKKVWSDDKNESGKRPKTVVISLLANGKVYDQYKFNSKENWKHVFNNLPVYLDGEKVEYSVLEEEVQDGYVVAYEKTKNGFIVHNVLGQGGEKPPTKNPQTGDNIILYITILFIGILGFIISNVYDRRLINQNRLV